jgi:hypothetical protein
MTKLVFVLALILPMVASGVMIVTLPSQPLLASPPGAAIFEGAADEPARARPRLATISPRRTDDDRFTRYHESVRPYLRGASARRCQINRVARSGGPSPATNAPNVSGRSGGALSDNRIDPSARVVVM